MTTTQTASKLESPTSAVPDRIVLATDLSDLDYLLPHAIAQCEACASSLFIVHVIPPVNSASIKDAVYLLADTARAHAEKLVTQANDVLDAAAQKTRASGIYCETFVRHGHAREAIPTFTYRVHAGRLILGTHGRTNLKKFFLGSVALEALKNTSIPVWTVGPHARPTPHGRPSKILHPVSLSSDYQKAAKLAVQIAQLYEAEITLLHVLPRTSLVEYPAARLTEWAKRKLELVIPDETPLRATTQLRVEAGEIAERILAVAAEWHVDLIVMGANSETGHWPAYDDNTVYNVIAGASCPVLSLRYSNGHEVHTDL